MMIKISLFLHSRISISIQCQGTSNACTHKKPIISNKCVRVYVYDTWSILDCLFARELLFLLLSELTIMFLGSIFLMVSISLYFLLSKNMHTRSIIEVNMHVDMYMCYLI